MSVAVISLPLPVQYLQFLDFLLPHYSSNLSRSNGLVVQCRAGGVRGDGVREPRESKYRSEELIANRSRSFLFGYDSGVMTDVIVSPHFLDFFHTTKTSSIVGAIVSTFSGGAVFGSLMGGVTMDRIGRKWTVQMGAIICLFGAILQSAAQNLGMMLAGRILTGWAVGLMSMAVPVYLSETAHPNVRGLIVGITQQMIGIGYIVSTWVGYGSSHVPKSSSFSWRFPLAFQNVPCFIVIFGLLFFPESPRYLIETDREEEAMRVVRKTSLMSIVLFSDVSSFIVYTIMVKTATG
jgi:MFS family permease